MEIRVTDTKNQETIQLVIEELNDTHTVLRTSDIEPVISRIRWITKNPERPIKLVSYTQEEWNKMVDPDL